MGENVIEVFARGNQELFHSAFVAWLIDPCASHGFGSAVLRALLRRLPPAYSMGLSEGFNVTTEYRDGRSRFDILVTPQKPVGGTKGLVFENKVKSFGSRVQLEAYKDRGYNVAVLALLPETLDRQVQETYPVIEYQELLAIIESMPIDQRNGYLFIVSQFAEFIKRTLKPFDVLRSYCTRKLDLQDFVRQMGGIAGESNFSDNDLRTLSYFYFHNFAEYLRKNATDLCFGEDGYEDAAQRGSNTDWLMQKNMQGSPFMEVLLHSPIDPNSYWVLEPPLRRLHKQAPFIISPRLELWLEPRSLGSVSPEQTEVGQIMLGTWTNELKRFLGNTEPYRSRLLPCGSRNFHREILTTQDLPFRCMARRLRRMVGLLFTRNSD